MNAKETYEPDHHLALTIVFFLDDTPLTSSLEVLSNSEVPSLVTQCLGPHA